MNVNKQHNDSMCNQNLPLKKRRTYYMDSLLSNDEQDENSSKILKPSYTQDDSYQIHMPSNVPTPPSSPHMDFLRQQNYFQPSIYQYLMAQQYRLLHDRQQQQQQYGYSMIEDEQKRNDLIIDEHFRKSLGDNYNKYSSRCLTPDDSSSNSSSTAVDSIEEHFARSLAKFQPLNQDETTTINHHVNESVDDHFAKALGTKTWQKLKEKN